MLAANSVLFMGCKHFTDTIILYLVVYLLVNRVEGEIKRNVCYTLRMQMTYLYAWNKLPGQSTEPVKKTKYFNTTHNRVIKLQLFWMFHI